MPNEIQKMQAYIRKHGAPRNLRFDICVQEALVIADEMHPIDGIELAFLYGRAKGYRQAMLDLKKEKSA